jgi:hypothetical protein
VTLIGRSCATLAGNLTPSIRFFAPSFHYSTQTDRNPRFVDMLNTNTVLRKVYTHGVCGPRMNLSAACRCHPLPFYAASQTIAPALVDICSNFFFPADATRWRQMSGSLKMREPTRRNQESLHRSAVEIYSRYPIVDCLVLKYINNIVDT